MSEPEETLGPDTIRTVTPPRRGRGRQTETLKKLHITSITKKSIYITHAQ